MLGILPSIFSYNYIGVKMKRLKCDLVLLTTTILLVIFGLLMVYSASNVVALYKYDDAYYYLKRQLIFAGIGISLMILIININLTKIYKYSTIIFLLSILCLILVLIPGIGVVRGGARSWIGIGSLSFQPSELVKVSIIIFLSKYFSKYEKDLLKFKYFMFMLIIIGCVFGLIMLQPDFGTGLVIVLSSFILLFMTGAPFKYFLILLLIGLCGIVALIISAPYRMERIFSFLDPWSDPLGSGFQAIQSLYALAPSGLFGLGYNKSIQKHFFLPEPQNDFIFAIVAEELGLFGAAILLGLFLILIFRIIKIALNINNAFYKYISFGISLVFFVQVFINIGVVIGLLPVTGITLPIISYGGTSLMISLIMIGIVLNISKYRGE